MAKEFDPEDPLELVGVELPGGDPEVALDTIVQEYLMQGWSPLQILWLFRSPAYAGTHQLFRLKGGAYIKDRVQAIAEAWERGWLAGGKVHG